MKTRCVLFFTQACDLMCTLACVLACAGVCLALLKAYRVLAVLGNGYEESIELTEM